MEPNTAETDLSIVIPVWNESDKIALDIRYACRFLEEARLHGEIIISDDGSTDGTVSTVRDLLPACHAKVNIVEIPVHHGKGKAVQEGIIRSSGAIVMFVDSGSCVPYIDIRRGVSLIQTGKCDIAHGSRLLPDSRILRGQPLTRRFFSAAFRYFVKKLFRLPDGLTDTQCGLKLYRGDLARSLYRESRIQGFMFDIEIILLAIAHGARILEFPVHWRSDPDSRLALPAALPQIARDLFILAFHDPVSGLKMPK